jgi:hypothetical protein
MRSPEVPVFSCEYFEPYHVLTASIQTQGTARECEGSISFEPIFAVVNPHPDALTKPVR